MWDPFHDAPRKSHEHNNFDDHRPKTARANSKAPQPLNHFAAEAARQLFDISNQSHADERFSPAPDRTTPKWEPCQTLDQLFKTRGESFGHLNTSRRNRQKRSPAFRSPLPASSPQPRAPSPQPPAPSPLPSC